MVHKSIHAALTSAAAGLFAAVAVAAPQLVVINADVYTADPARPHARAVAIENGRIRAVGSDAEIRALAGPATRVIDAGGRLVVPGLIEAHVHLGWDLPSPPLELPGLPFPGPSAEQVLDAVGKAARSAQQGWISAWVGPLVARDPRPWREALDAVAPDTPVLLRGFWGHTTIVNSAALRRLRIAEDVPDPLGGWWGRDPSGRLDGRAYEAAETIEQEALPADPERLAQALRDAGARYAGWGVTSIHLMNSGRPLPAMVDALKLARTPQRWTIYSWASSAGHVADAWKAIDRAPRALPPRVRIDGPKWVLDGTGVEQNAYKRADYAGRPGWRGRSNYSDAQLRDILRQALRRPGQLALHVVGDAETDRLLAAMESLAPPAAWQRKRVRLEHGDGIRPDTLARVARLGLVVTQNPLHLPQPDASSAAPLFDRASLLASLPRARIALALGSDAGADEANPFLNMMLATTYAARAGEALTREQALHAYTAGAAYAERREHFKGRITEGLTADLAVLSQDVRVVPPQALPATRSMLTIVNGVVAYEDPQMKATASAGRR